MIGKNCVDKVQSKRKYSILELTVIAINLELGAPEYLCTFDCSVGCLCELRLLPHYNWEPFVTIQTDLTVNKLQEGRQSLLDRLACKSVHVESVLSYLNFHISNASSWSPSCTDPYGSDPHYTIICERHIDFQSLESVFCVPPLSRNIRNWDCGGNI